MVAKSLQAVSPFTALIVHAVHAATAPSPGQSSLQGPKIIYPKTYPCPCSGKMDPSLEKRRLPGNSGEPRRTLIEPHRTIHGPPASSLPTESGNAASFPLRDTSRPIITIALFPDSGVHYNLSNEEQRQQYLTVPILVYKYGEGGRAVVDTGDNPIQSSGVFNPVDPR
ncbi:hypothetical protein HYALB_00012426 [Hymenoscyphus albidus]|uniref:Uncharacterized protein n=1 Tax=Hymenoscyphus albidus TaxID=595503 RepID=A0A9N9LS86_9HELO|nr:hypothetical protein HYALB_00012426 [Hymenoscyphus albidus]